MPASQRRTIFISHANPADNDVAAWLAVKLTALGYSVWVDVEKLRGGETIWREIERVMRTEARCLILVLSSRSYNRDGLLKEMTLGLTLEKHLDRFVLPWIIDDLPFELMPIEIQGRMSIPESRWSLALPKIVAYLTSIGIMRAERPDTKCYLEALLVPESCGVQPLPAYYELNRIQALSLPDFLYSVDSDAPVGSEDVVTENVFRERRLSFSPIEGTRRLFGRGNARPYETKNALVVGVPTLGLDTAAMRRIIVELTRKVIDQHLRNRSLVPYTMARRNPVYYFNSHTIASRKIKIKLPENSKSSYRHVWGKYKDVYWHLGMEFSVAFHEILVVTLNPHILFTKDGLEEPLLKDPELNKIALHKKRRSVSRSWFNDKWRGFFYPFLAHVSDGQEEIRIETAGNTPLLLSKNLATIQVPITHTLVKELWVDDNPDDEEEGLSLD